MDWMQSTVMKIETEPSAELLLHHVAWYLCADETLMLADGTMMDRRQACIEAVRLAEERMAVVRADMPPEWHESNRTSQTRLINQATASFASFLQPDERAIFPPHSTNTPVTAKQLLLPLIELCSYAAHVLFEHELLRDDECVTLKDGTVACGKALICILTERRPDESCSLYSCLLKRMKPGDTAEIAGKKYDFEDVGLLHIFSPQ